MSFATMVRDSQPERAKRLEAIETARRLVARVLKHHPAELRNMRARLTHAARWARNAPIDRLAAVDEIVGAIVEYVEHGPWRGDR